MHSQYFLQGSFYRAWKKQSRTLSVSESVWNFKVDGKFRLKVQIHSFDVKVPVTYSLVRK